MTNSLLQTAHTTYSAQQTGLARLLSRAAQLTALLSAALVSTFAVAAQGDLRPPTLGASGAIVEVIEFSDFECPYCVRGRNTVEKLQARYGDKVRVTFVHLPLAFHRNARAAAKVAVAAQRQGQFWSMNKMLFASSRSLSDARYTAAARQLGLDMSRFREDLADPAVDAFVTRNSKIAAALGATGTPTYFINGKKLRGAQPLPKFAAVVDAELAAYDNAPRPGFIKARTLAANPDLSRYVHAWESPPDKPARRAESPTKRPRKPVSEDVFRATVDLRKDPIRGPKNALVTMVVFSDFECPFCQRHDANINKLRKAYAKDLRIVFKHLPLVFHKGAKPLALTGICAKEQGKFWAFHDATFSAGAKPDNDAMVRAAKLNRRRLAKCLKRKTTTDKLEADAALARQLGARGTPNSFINGRPVRGAVAYDVLDKLIKEELTKARKLIQTGTKRSKLYPKLMKGAKVVEAVEDKVVPGLNDGAPRRGAKRAKAVITIFGDFQCPYCARSQQSLAALEKKYRGKVAVVYRHMPLSHHKRATPAALASMCANDQGKFWAYHDRIYDQPKDLSDEALLRHAAAIGLNSPTFGACFEDKKHTQALAKEIELARTAGVRGTPTFFVNGRKVKSTGQGNLETAVRQAVSGK